jgi:uncharacterized membrane protein YheB (UPF0754 family)
MKKVLIFLELDRALFSLSINYISRREMLMIRMILLILLQGISGGISGYITNKYAVNMLFKEYTPLKLGGVVKKKREKFIEEISELVERDIINSETLRVAISSKNLKPYIEQISEFFFEKGLEGSIGNLKVSEIADLYDTANKSEEFLRENLYAILPGVLDNIVTKVNLEDILSEKQISQIIKAGYDLLISEIEKSTTLNEFISDLYNENSDITLSELISEEIQKKLIKNITENIIQIVNENILEDEKSCEVFFDSILKAIDIERTLIKLQDTIGNCPINKFITASEEKEITIRLYNKINDFINSSKGKALVLDFINELYLIGEDIDFTIYEILPPEMEASLTNFIKTVIPKVMPYISEWISNNKVSFDEMIEEAIDEAIDGMDENIKKLVISKVRNALMGDISSKNDIVSKVIDYFDDSLDDDAYNNLTSNIISYLKDKKIKDMIKLLEKQELLSSEKTAEFIIKQFNTHGKNILEVIVKTQFSKSINKFIKLDFVDLFDSKLKSALYKNIFKNKDKINEKLKIIIREFISIKGYELFHKKLSELFTANKVLSFSNKFRELTCDVLKSSKEIYEEKIEKFIVSKTKNINLVEILDTYKGDICDFIVDNSVVFYKRTVDKNKERKVKDLICTYFNKEQLSSILINKGYPALISKLPDLLDGNVKKFAKNNLSKYDEDEICDIVQEFMGNQLKPLSVFGGILGTAVGIIYQMIFPNSIGSYGFPGSVLNLIMSLILMAGIGYITNVIALWMIFHPYKENKIVAKIPFFKKFALGYIPAHKNQFAIGMAKLIDEELLNKEEINKSFNLHKKNTQSVLMSLVTNNNYQILINIIETKKQDLSNYIYHGILKCCGNNSKLSKRISEGIEESKFSKFIKRKHILNIIPKLIDSINNVQNYLVNFAQNKLCSSYAGNKILPKDVSSEVRNYVQMQMQGSLKEKVNSIRQTDFINIIIDNYKKDYELQIKKSCKDIFEKDFIEQVKNNLEMKAYSYFSGDFKIYIDDQIKHFLNSELDENKDIGSMFNGRVKELIDNNVYTITSYITDKAISYLQNNEDEFIFTVRETIKNNLNFFEKIAYGTFGGDAIAGKVVEIILYKKLPIMIRNEIGRIMNIAKFTLDNNIYPMKVSELKIKADEINTAMLLDNVFERFNNKIDLKQYINKVSDLVLEPLISTPIIEYLEPCNLQSLDLIYKKFHEEADIVKYDIYNKLSNNIEELSKVSGEFLDEKILMPLFELYSSNAFEGATTENIEETVKNVLNLVSSSEVTKKHLIMLWESLYNNTLSQMQIKQIINCDMLEKDIENIIDHIFNNVTFCETNIVLIEKVVQNAINNNLDFISDETKNYLIDKVMQAGLSSISEHIVPILQEINLKNITNKQIELLNPKEIDILFNSFAGDFFSKLRFYGVFGFVFGINVGLSIILWALDLRYSKISSQKDINTLRDS